MNARTQKVALMQLAKMAQRGMEDPSVRAAAKAITSDVPARYARGELSAIYEAVKHGTPKVQGLAKGVRYVSDPINTDYFVGPAKLLAECRAGSCAEDCDSQAALVAALAGALGIVVGLRAYGSDPRGDYEHVYAVAWTQADGVLGLDTTVPSAKVGWEPPSGRYLTAWIY